MENIQTPQFSVSGFIAALNQSLDLAFGMIEVEGEVSSFKVNQSKYVFFDLKDDSGLVNCFMTVWQLKIPIEDGMRVVVRATPKVTDWGRFSLTVQQIRPVGEGSIKRARALLAKKLEKEGLFAEDRKRHLPTMPDKIGVISSVESAGYRDFIKILNERWGGLSVDVAHVQVQGESSPGQIVRAIEYFNTLPELPEVLVLIRGGGAAEDLAAFDDESVVRSIAASRIPTLVGVGHEVDETLSDLVADFRASTPTHAAQVVVPDRREVSRSLESSVRSTLQVISRRREHLSDEVDEAMTGALSTIRRTYNDLVQRYRLGEQLALQLDPRTVLRRGYALVRDDQGRVLVEPGLGDMVSIETSGYNIKAEVKDVKKKTN